MSAAVFKRFSRTLWHWFSSGLNHTACSVKKLLKESSEVGRIGHSAEGMVHGVLRTDDRGQKAEDRDRNREVGIIKQRAKSIAHGVERRLLLKEFLK